MSNCKSRLREGCKDCNNVDMFGDTCHAYQAYQQGRVDERAKILDEFVNWLKEKGIHGSKEFIRIVQMYEDESKEQK